MIATIAPLRLLDLFARNHGCLALNGPARFLVGGRLAVGDGVAGRERHVHRLIVLAVLGAFAHDHLRRWITATDKLQFQPNVRNRTKREYVDTTTERRRIWYRRTAQDEHGLQNVSALAWHKLKRVDKANLAKAKPQATSGVLAANEQADRSSAGIRIGAQRPQLAIRAYPFRIRLALR